MGLTIFTIFIVLLSLGAPLGISILLFILNIIIPDSIPFGDEFIQGLSIAGKIKNGARGIKTVSWILYNPKKSIVFAALILVLIFLFINK